MIGAPEIADDPRFADGASRLEHRDELDAVIGDALPRTRTTAEWVDLLAEIVPCGPVLRIDEVFADPQVQHLRDDPNGRRPDAGDRSTCCARRSPSATRRRRSARGAGRRARTRATCWPSSDTPTRRSTTLHAAGAVATEAAAGDDERDHDRHRHRHREDARPRRGRHRLDDLQQPGAPQRDVGTRCTLAVPRILSAFRDDPDVHVIVVTGAGDAGVRLRRRHLRVRRAAHDGRRPRRLRRRAGRRVARCGVRSTSRSSR